MYKDIPVSVDDKTLARWVDRQVLIHFATEVWHFTRKRPISVAIEALPWQMAGRIARAVGEGE